jgi:hypothetical protein
MKKMSAIIKSLCLTCCILTLFSTNVAGQSENTGSSESAIDTLDGNAMDNATAIMEFSLLPNIAAAKAEFDSITGCDLQIYSYLGKEKKAKDPFNLLTIIKNLFRQAAKSNAIRIGVAWEATDKGYDIRTHVSVDAEDVFSREALQAFTDSLNDRHSETLDAIAVPQATHRKILAMLKALRDAGEPKSVTFSLSKDLSKPMRLPWFDDNDKEHCSAYPTYKENEPYMYPSASVTLYAHVTPPNQAEKIEVTDDAMLTSGDTNPRECVIFSGVSGAVAAYKKGDESRKPLGKINVIEIPSKKREVEITICKVKYKTEQDYPAVNVTAINVNLAKIYGVANQTFTLLEKSIEIESPDKNANGMLDVGERDTLKASLPKVTGYTIFIINQGIESKSLGGREAAGYGKINKSYPRIPNYPVMVITKKASVETCTHEIGHTVFALEHPFDEFSSHRQGKDPYNIMDYQRKYGETQLRAYQVKQILKITP